MVGDGRRVIHHQSDRERARLLLGLLKACILAMIL
jgi:hypothetical protein